jgi:hypothetical protein
MNTTVKQVVRTPEQVVKTTLVNINGRVILVNGPLDKDGKVRVDIQSLATQLGIPRGSCIYGW